VEFTKADIGYLYMS